MRLADALSARAGLEVAILGMVGAGESAARRRRWDEGLDPSPPFVTGSKTPLSDCAAGWLMLSPLPNARREGLVRRLSAEAGDHKAFRPAELEIRAQACRADGFAHGPAGSGAGLSMCAALAPARPGEPPLAVAFVFRPGDKVDPFAGTTRYAIFAFRSMVIVTFAGI